MTDRTRRAWRRLRPHDPRRFLITAAAAAVLAGVGGVGLAIVTLWIDGITGLRVPAALANSRVLLGGLTTSLVTLAVFSIWMRSVVVGLASSQISPRIVSSYLEDGFQWRLIVGMSAAFTFTVTSLLGLPSGEDARAPAITTSLSVLAVVVGMVTVLAALRSAVHGLSLPQLLSTLATRAQAALEEETGPDDPWPDAAPPARVTDVEAPRMGWVSRIDHEALLDAIPPETHVGLFVDAGSFVARSDPMAVVDRELDGDTLDAIVTSVQLAAVRRPDGDFGFVVQQLGDVAQQALGSGGRDSSTSHEALLYLRSVLTELIHQGVRSGHALGPEGRVITTRARKGVADHLWEALEPLTYAARRADPLGARSVKSAIAHLRATADSCEDRASAQVLQRLAAVLDGEDPESPETSGSHRPSS